MRIRAGKARIVRLRVRTQEFSNEADESTFSVVIGKQNLRFLGASVASPSGPQAVQKLDSCR